MKFCARWNRWGPLNLLCFCFHASAQIQYQVVPIPPPPGSGAILNYGVSINDFGSVVGGYFQPADPPGFNQTRSFLYTDGAGALDAWPEQEGSYAEGINNSGQIALYTTPREGPYQAYRFTPGVGYENLGVSGKRNSETTDINNLGQVTGFEEKTDGHEQAFRYTDTVGLENIGSSFTSSRGFAINDNGWVAGYGDGNAFLYRDDLGVIDLGPGRGFGINSDGTVVGLAFTPLGTYEAFIYEDGQKRLLNQPGFSSTILGDINNQGMAVGIGLDTTGRNRALAWTETEGLVDLNLLIPEDSGWTLISGTAINELGQITGTGSFNGMPLAYRLDPIPEPTTWALLSLGGLIWWVCRRKHP